ncbi:MAG: alkaline phosphatase family protein, partial [Natronosporangium sp.]
MTVYWVVWDAAAAWLVDALDAEGALPAVRRLRRTGIRASARPPAPNCQTPAALATLFTGTGTDTHRVTGFDLPGGPDQPVEWQRSGFEPGVLAAEPVWQAARAAGLRTAFVHVPWV